MKEPSLQEIVGDLMERGWTQEQLAEEIGCTQPTISKLLAGADAMYSRGILLRDLWQTDKMPPKHAARA